MNDLEKFFETLGVNIDSRAEQYHDQEGEQCKQYIYLSTLSALAYAFADAIEEIEGIEETEETSLNNE